MSLDSNQYASALEDQRLVLSNLLKSSADRIKKHLLNKISIYRLFLLMIVHIYFVLMSPRWALSLPQRTCVNFAFLMSIIALLSCFIGFGLSQSDLRCSF
jgi:hypothetical protein